MKLYYNNYQEAMDVLRYVPLQKQPSKFIKTKGSELTISESKRKELRKKRKKR